MAAMDVQVRIRAIDQFSNTLDKLQRKLKGLDGAKGGLGANDGLGVAYSRRADRLAKSVAHAEQKHAAASQSAGMPGGMPAFGLPAGLIGGAALGVGIQKTVAAAADFESSLTGIQKKSGATNEQMKAIGEEIKQIATNGSLAVSIDEIAAGYERGAAGGIPLNELREFAVLSAKASDAFEMSASDVANAAAGFNKVLGVPMTEMERMFDLINGLADAGIADESGIVDYMDRAGAVSKTFGLTAQETAAIGAALANLKVPAERASTAMNSVLTKLLAPNALSGDAREALGRLVGDFDKFGRSIKKDASGTLVGLLKQLKELDSISRTEIIAELFGQDHLDVVSQMVEGLDEVERNLKYAAGQDWFGSLEGSYKLKLDDFWSQWQIVKNALGRLMIDLGTMGMPAFKAGLEGAIALINQIDQGLDAFKIDLDWGAINEAKTAVGELVNEVGRLIGVEGDASIRSFFEDLAAGVNDLAGKIKRVADELEAIAKFAQDPIGEMTRPKTPEEERKLDEDDFRFITPEHRARLIEEKARKDAGLPTAPVSPKALRSGRVGFDANPFEDGRYARGSAPQMDQSALEEAVRVRRAAQVAAPATPVATATPLPDISTVPIPTPRPDIDNTAFLEKTGAMQAALNGLGQTVRPTVDVDTSSAMAKIAALRAEINSVSSATVGAGYGANFNARVRDQF